MLKKLELVLAKFHIVPYYSMLSEEYAIDMWGGVLWSLRVIWIHLDFAMFDNKEHIVDVDVEEKGTQPEASVG